MAIAGYLVMEGEKNGKIKGGVTQKGREESILVIALTHEIVSPRDPASGLPTGKRMHKPFVITKEVDKSSPILYNVLVNNENIKKWELKLWEPSSSGVEKQHYTVRLTNANIASIHFKMANVKNVELSKYKEYEEIAFTYQAIEWVWTDGGISAGDDWLAPV